MLSQACKSAPRTWIRKRKYAITYGKRSAFCVGTKHVARTLCKEENNRIISQHRYIPRLSKSPIQ